MKSARLLYVTFVLGATAGCDTVLAVTPMGEEIVSAPREEWEGIWLVGEFTFILQVTDESAGELRASWIDLPNGTPELSSVPIKLRRSGDWLFANLGPDDDSGEWTWLRVERTGDGFLRGDALIGWFPSASMFSELVSQGVLPGTVSRDGYWGTTEVTLGELTSEHYELITSNVRGVLLEWEKPVFLSRHRDNLN